MKKSLIAVAALLASGAALAQSNVTLYGRVDLSVGNLKDKVKNTSTTQMFHGGDGGLTTSRWGLRGTEDLGGGLKAAFRLENRFEADTGKSQDPYFRGESSLSLMGGFGEVKLGRSATVYDEVRGLGQSRNVFDSAFTPSSNGVFRSGGDYSSRWDNKISYYSPNMGGFYAAIDYAFDEKAGVSEDRHAIKIGYKQKEFEVALGHQNEKDKKDKYTVLAAMYDFGSFSVSGLYNRRDGTAANGDDNEYALGVTVPMGAFAFSGGYAHSKTKGSTRGAKDGKAKGFGLGLTYSLSKRTRLYAGWRDVEVKDNKGTRTKDERLYAVGVRHDF